MWEGKLAGVGRVRWWEGAVTLDRCGKLTAARKMCWGKFADVDSCVEDLQVCVMPIRKSFKFRESMTSLGEVS